MEYLEVLFHAHSCLLEGHFFVDIIAKAIMRVGLWWPIFEDKIKYNWRCDECQRYKALIQSDKMPLVGDGC